MNIPEWYKPKNLTKPAAERSHSGTKDTLKSIWILNPMKLYASSAVTFKSSFTVIL